MKLTPWIIALCGLAFGAAIAWQARQDAARAAKAQRTAEAKQLAAEGFTVVANESAIAARAEAAKLLAANKTLDAEVARLQSITPKTRIVYRERASTAPIPATGTPLESIDDCLVRIGTPLRVDHTALHLETDAGNQVVVGTGQCVRVLPDPETVIAEGLLKYQIAATVAPSCPTHVPAWLSAAAGVLAGGGAVWLIRR